MQPWAGVLKRSSLCVHCCNELLPVRTQKCYIGHAAQMNRGILSLTHPMDRGRVRDWGDMQKILEDTLKNQLHVDLKVLTYCHPFQPCKASVCR